VTKYLVCLDSGNTLYSTVQSVRKVYERVERFDLGVSLFPTVGFAGIREVSFSPCGGRRCLLLWVGG
jgi:hypothetical protein